jgi:D-alanyl-D-alanine carboxypeptidase
MQTLYRLEGRSPMNHWLSIGFVGAFLVGCSAFPNADHPTDRGLGDRVDALMAPLVAAHEFSGAVVMERGGRVVYKRGFGIANHAEGLAFTPETAADSGSLAKPFTAAGIWWLAHEGKIALGDPVQRYVPEYPHPQTKIEHLLSHSNGLPPDYAFFDPYLGTEGVRTTAAMLQVVARQAPRPSFTPGAQYEYSNLGYDAAGLRPVL